MIKFGTSGFRGVINEGFTKENLSRIIFALCKIIEQDQIKNPKIVVGFDNRLMSVEMAELVAQMLSSRGIETTLFTKSVPSPLITFMTKKYNFGIMITASHNPANYNGIKIFLNPGKEADDEFSERIEKIANKVDTQTINNLLNSPVKSPITKTANINAYCQNIIRLVDKDNIKNKNLKILFDVMNGSSTDCVCKIADELEMKNCEIINTNVDHNFGGKIPAPYKHNLIEQSKLVKKCFDLGIAFDADGDRISVIDKDGTFYDCNYLLPIIYSHFLNKGYKGDVIKNTALSNLTKLIAEKHGFKCYETKVGFKHIGKYLETTSAFLGGESNGIAFKENILSKDGICIAFILIDILSVEGKTIKQLLNKLQKEYDFESEVVEYSYPITNEQKHKITKLLFEDKKLPKTKLKINSVSYMDGLKITYENDYWGVFRFSGNENVIRLFAEMPTKKDCDKLIALYESFIGIKMRQI